MAVYLFRCPLCGRDHDVTRAIKDRNKPFYCEALHEQTACQRIVTPPGCRRQKPCRRAP
jgi:hypothetical protein